MLAMWGDGYVNLLSYSIYIYSGITTTIITTSGFLDESDTFWAAKH